MSRVLLRSETPLFAPFIHQLHHFTKTGSGQTGKTQKRVAFRTAPISSPIKKAREGRTGTERCGNRLLCACFTKKPLIYQDRLRTNYIGQVEKQKRFSAGPQPGPETRRRPELAQRGVRGGAGSWCGKRLLVFASSCLVEERDGLTRQARDKQNEH